MPKKVKKKIKFKIVPTFIFLISIVILYFVINFLLDTKIKNIYIIGNNIVKDQEIIELAGIDNYPSFYKTLSKTIKKRILKNELIKDVQIKKKFFNVLEINITEYVPVFIKDNMTVLENKKKIDNISYKLPILNNLEENKTYDDLIKEILKLNNESKANISQIIYSPSEYDKTRFLLYMDDGNHVYINISKFSNINYYSEIYPTLKGKKGTLYLDSGNHFEVFK